MAQLPHPEILPWRPSTHVPSRFAKIDIWERNVYFQGHTFKPHRQLLSQRFYHTPAGAKTSANLISQSPASVATTAADQANGLARRPLGAGGRLQTRWCGGSAVLQHVLQHVQDFVYVLFRVLD